MGSSLSSAAAGREPYGEGDAFRPVAAEDEGGNRPQKGSYVIKFIKSGNADVMILYHPVMFTVFDIYINVGRSL